MSSNLIRLITVLIFLSSQVSGQEEPAPSNSSNIKSFKIGHIKEKIYLQTDKSFYMSGEICWFKLYDLDRETNRLLDLSKVAYVEVLDKDNKPVLQCKISLDKGQGSGSLFLPLTMESANFHLRAYTNFMQNSEPAFYYSKDITIVNPGIAPENTNSGKQSYDMQFFPEGGNLVNGISSKVAFRIVNQQGFGLTCKGQIFDHENRFVAQFQSYKFGMGSFIFTPQKGESYYGVVSENNREIKKDLPVAFNQGYTIAVTVSLPQVYTVSLPQVYTVSVAASPEFNDAHPTLALLKGTAIQKTWGFSLVNGKAILHIDKKLLKGGISCFTLLNSSMHPVCERVIFVSPKKKLEIKADSLKSFYHTRDQVSFTVKTRNEFSVSEPANLSISVSSTDTLTSIDDDNNMLSYAYLQSELRGHIESAPFYLNPSNEGWSVAIDNLMLVQGWRRFKWEELTSDSTKPFAFLPELHGHIINARVVDNHTGHFVPNVTAYLSIPGTRLQFYVCKSDSLGLLRFVTQDFYGPGEIVAQVHTVHDSTCHVEISSPFSSRNTSENIEPLHFDYTLFNLVSKHSMSMQVQNVYHGEAYKRFLLPPIDSSNFYGIPDEKYRLDDYTRFTTMEEVIREYVRKTVLAIRQKKYELHVLHTYFQEFFQDAPLILYDGLPIFSSDQMVRQDPLKIKNIDVVARSFFYGPNTYDGIINFTSYHGDFPGMQLDPNALVMDYEGMQVERQFYSPIYETSEKQNSRIPDFRNTLYWSPLVAIGKDGIAHINFYTSDLKGTFKIIVEGISPEGRIAHQRFNFEVRN